MAPRTTLRRIALRLVKLRERAPTRWASCTGPLVALGVTLLVVVSFIGFVLLRALKPQGDEWSVRVGPQQHALSVPLSVPVSVPVLLRWGTHPLALPLLNGRSLRTKAGTWRVVVAADGAVQATCQPCVLRLHALGSAPLVLNRVLLTARRAGPEAWAGTVDVGQPPQRHESEVVSAAASAAHTVRVSWQAKLRRDGLAWTAQLNATPVAALLATLDSPAGHAVPEARQAQVDGSFAFTASAQLNQHGFTQLKVKPALHDLRVSGLGTEALATAQPPALCRPTRARIDGWLPRAVIAAEDQRFFEHAGFDMEEALLAWAGNQRRAAHVEAADAGSSATLGATSDTPRGASTLTQQLAKWVYTGDERSAARKLREWLYAVEMERTLGKGRILQLYLALAPWGGKLCGAEAAARRYLAKPANKLEPHEAAWLASLLRSPDAQLARWRAEGNIDHHRTARVIDGLRPMPKWQREAHVDRLHAWQLEVHSRKHAP